MTSKSKRRLTDEEFAKVASEVYIDGKRYWEEEQKEEDTTVDRNKRHLIQIKNPRTGRYVKIDKNIGKILSEKRTKGPYKGILKVSG
ncbi:unnamed protein product [marine sediment metagenome]|uniref:Uncharacterized protein n=1 Tax=marine sediment metagenome TaxID=412755 RepID=X0T8I4_9ZZZZ